MQLDADTCWGWAGGQGITPLVNRSPYSLSFSLHDGLSGLAFSFEVLIRRLCHSL